MSGWRTVQIEDPAKLSVTNNTMKIAGLDGSQSALIPLDELAHVVISTQSALISARLLEQLSAHNISVLFCDVKHNPSCELLPISRHEDSAGCIMDQTLWEAKRKAEIWSQIVRMKLENQIRALIKCDQAVPAQMRDYINEIEPGDPGNREALAARAYFTALFGRGFVRHAPDATNAALNYGYTLLMSAMSRALVMYGYNTALGIHHKSRSNHFNLACDLMEPFRPFVDVMVYRHAGRSLDKSYKRELISLLRRRVIYDGKRFTLDDAISAFALSACKLLGGAEGELPEVYFE